MPDVLPNSIPHFIKGRKWNAALGAWFVEIFCASCCTQSGGWVLEDAVEPSTGFAFYLCDDCGAKWGALADTHAIPDEAFWAKMNAAMLEKYGRILSADEQAEALRHEDHILTKLAKERQHRPK